MSGRNGQITRILKTFQLLENSRFGLSTRQIWQELQERGWEVNQRTVYRDLKALEAAGFPLIELGSDDKQATKWKVKADTSFGKHLILSSSEMVSLHLARAYLGSYKQVPFYHEIDGVFQKIFDHLGDRALSFLKELEEDFQVDQRTPSVHSIDDGVMETCRAGCAEDQWLELTYQSANSGKTKKRRLGPLTIYFSQGGYYLIALDSESSSIKTFAMSRIKEASLLDEAFDKPDFNIDEYFASGFGIYKGGAKQIVLIKVTGARSHYIAERMWHQSQQLVSQKPQEATLRFELDPTPEFVSWLLSLGADVEVFEPPALRETLKAEIEKMLRLCA